LNELVEHLAHRGRVAAHDGGRRRDVAGGVEMLRNERDPVTWSVYGSSGTYCRR
jgi:hypothetical protein